MFRMFRLLLDPAAVEGGSGETPPPVTPPASSGGVTLTADEYALLHRRLTEAEQRLAGVDQERQAAVERERQAALEQIGQRDGVAAALRAANEQAQQELARTGQQVSTWQSRYLDAQRQSLTAGAFSGVQFAAEDAGEDARAKLDRMVETVLDGDQVVHRFRGTGRPATVEAIREVVQGPGFAHFLAPASRGGSGATGGDRPAPKEKEKELTASERLFAAVKAGKKAPGGAIGIGPRS